MTHWTRGIIILIVTCSVGVPVFGALNTADIDKVNKKAVLDPQDLAAIDKFVAAGVQEIVATTDFSSIGNLRAEIVARSHSNQNSVQYDPQFITAAGKSLEKAFGQARQIADPNVQSKVALNLMILLDNLNSPKLADVALKMIDSGDAALRYWAVHAVTNPAIVEQFNNGKAPASEARTIAERLAERVKTETSPYILAQIAQFGATANIPQAEGLFTQIVDMRLKKYQTWSVDNLSLDATVLNLLAQQIAGPNKANAGWRFGQLYSYMLEMYIKGKANMDAAQKDQLGMILGQVESRVFAKLGIPPSGIKLAIDKKEDQKLPAEYKDLFGDGTTAGKLTTTLSIEYTNADGTKRATPVPLPDPPKPAK